MFVDLWLNRRNLGILSKFYFSCFNAGLILPSLRIFLSSSLSHALWILFAFIWSLLIFTEGAKILFFVSCRTNQQRLRNLCAKDVQFDFWAVNTWKTIVLTFLSIIISSQRVFCFHSISAFIQGCYSTCVFATHPDCFKGDGSPLMLIQTWWRFVLFILIVVRMTLDQKNSVFFRQINFIFSLIFKFKLPSKVMLLLFVWWSR